MKKVMSTLLLLCFFCLGSYAQLTHTIEKNDNGVISSVRFSKSSDGQDIPASEVIFFKEYLKTSSDDQFIKVPHTSNRKEFVHDHFDQYYKNVKVDGGGYNFHYRNGRMYFANGHYVKINNLNVVPSSYSIPQIQRNTGRPGSKK